MSLFSKSKLFLEVRSQNLFLTPKIISIRKIVLNKNTVNLHRLSTFKVFFLKNTYINEDNMYFNTTINSKNLDLQFEDIKTEVKQVISKDIKSNDFESNKILNYSRFPGTYLSYEHTFSFSDFNSEEESNSSTRLYYNLDIVEENGFRTTFDEYYENPRENYKCLIIAYDGDQNIIDTSKVIDLGINSETLFNLEYDELISLFKSEVIAPNTRLLIGQNKITIENFKISDEIDEGIIVQKFDKDNEAVFTSLSRLSGGTTSYNFDKNYPSLNSSFALFANENTINDDGSDGSDFIYGTRNGRLLYIDQESGLPVTNDSVLSDDELSNFRIEINRSSPIILKY